MSVQTICDLFFSVLFLKLCTPGHGSVPTGVVRKPHREITAWCKRFGAENSYNATGNGLLGGKNCQDGAWGGGAGGVQPRYPQKG